MSDPKNFQEWLETRKKPEFDLSLIIKLFHENAFGKKIAPTTQQKIILPAQLHSLHDPIIRLFRHVLTFSDFAMDSIPNAIPNVLMATFIWDSPKYRLPETGTQHLRKMITATHTLFSTLESLLHEPETPDLPPLKVNVCLWDVPVAYMDNKCDLDLGFGLIDPRLIDHVMDLVEAMGRLADDALTMTPLKASPSKTIPVSIVVPELGRKVSFRVSFEVRDDVETELGCTLLSLGKKIAALLSKK